MNFKNSVKMLGLFLMLGYFSSCDNLELFIKRPRAIYLNKQAQEKLKDEKAEPPQEQILEALEIDPTSYQLHSNLGIIFNRIKKNDDAEKSFKEALKMAELSKDPMGLFASHFNLGVYYGALKKIPEALGHYQQALNLNPTSTETKHNIELLWQSQQQQSGKGDSKEKSEQDQQENQENKDGDGDKDKEDPKEKEGKERQQSPKYKPRPFKSGDLSEGDAKKMLEELARQDKRIRSQFNNRQNKNSKEDANEKDW